MHISVRVKHLVAIYSAASVAVILMSTPYTLVSFTRH